MKPDSKKKKNNPREKKRKKEEEKKENLLKRLDVFASYYSKDCGVFFCLFSNFLLSNSAAQEISWLLGVSGLNGSLRNSLQSGEMLLVGFEVRGREVGREEEGGSL